MTNILCMGANKEKRRLFFQSERYNKIIKSRRDI